MCDGPQDALHCQDGNPNLSASCEIAEEAELHCSLERSVSCGCKDGDKEIGADALKNRHQAEVANMEIVDDDLQGEVVVENRSNAIYGDDAPRDNDTEEKDPE